MADLKKIDTLNIFLILCSCLIAHYFPFDLLLVSYAFIGPMHYLTQISWMHDRQYFSKKKFDAAPLYFLTAALLLFSDFYIFGLAIIISIAVISALQKDIYFRFLSFLVLFVLIIVLYIKAPAVRLALAFLPTILHVFFFTAAFMLYGAMKNNSRAGFVALVTLFGCALTFLLPFETGVVLQSVFAEKNYIFLRPLIDAFFSVANVSHDATAFNKVAGFTAFAYTYHYLNWFSKTEVIRWHSVPKQRILLISVLYLLAVGVYLYDYGLGFKVLLYLSLLHVILELPLNVLTFKEIGKGLFRIRT